ncbi:MAG: FkbM family methyltransferase [Ginsengibacter sp.]
MNFLKKVKVLQLHFQKMGILNTLLFVGQILLMPRKAILFARVKNNAQKVFLRNIPSDRQIFQQIFLREELNVDFTSIPSVIIDGGANIGMATSYLKMKYPDAELFAIEPDNSNFQILEKNAKNFSSVKCYRNALWYKPALVEIINKDGGNESFIVKEVRKNSGTDLLQGITLREIIDENNLEKIDLLKLDIEGSETELFTWNYESWLSIVKNLLVETHNWINPESETSVMNATKGLTFVGMNGEYHFFKSKPVISL